VDVKEAINKRRAYRSLEVVNITEDIIEDLARSASLSCSCFNNQPWRFVFVYDKEKLKELFSALSKGNKWAYNASMIIAVFSRKGYYQPWAAWGKVMSLRDYTRPLQFAVNTIILALTQEGSITHRLMDSIQ